MCLKLDVLSLIDRISASNTEYQLTSGISLVREHNVNKTQNAKIVSGKRKELNFPSKLRIKKIFLL